MISGGAPTRTGGPPSPGATRRVQHCVSDPVQALHRRLLQRNEIPQRPHLTAVSVPGQLQIDTHLGRLDRLTRFVREKQGESIRIATCERGSQVRLVRGRRRVVVDAHDVDGIAAMLDRGAAVAKCGDPQCLPHVEPFAAVIGVELVVSR